MNTYFDYKDINLIPKKCIVNSRSECDTTVQLGNFKFELPIVPANMESVINEELAIELAKNNYFYVMHRFNNNIFDFVKKMKADDLYTSISIGVNQESYNLINKFVHTKIVPNYITIDIAHGHSNQMERMLKYIKSQPEFYDTYIIAGNVSTIEAVQDLCDWGANAIKVGIGPGSACTTYNNTGFGSRDIQLSIVKECCDFIKENKLKVDIIADGGITQVCDVAKSLVMGAKIIMIGGMLTGFKESPARIVSSLDGKIYQEFYGSASEHSKASDGNKKTKNIEGTIKLVPFKNKSIFDFMSEIKQALQSSISYGGGKDLSCLQNVKFIIKK
jgi:GMP reductase